MTFTPSHRGGAGEPLVCLHGFLDTWRTWDLVRPALERRHDVLAVTLAGHAGGPPLRGAAHMQALADAVEEAMDAAGMPTAHLVGNSLGGFVALQLATRGRARTAVALAPAGGWRAGDPGYAQLLDLQRRMFTMLQVSAPQAETVLSTVQGRRLATQQIVTNFEHIPEELLAHQLRGAARCTGALELLEHARDADWSLDGARLTCPIRVLWGTADRLLPWPDAAVRYREHTLAHAEWIELDGIGHCPQLDVPLETSQLILELTAP